MTTITTRTLFAVLLFLGLGASVASANTTVLSTDPSHTVAFEHYCPPYTQTFVEGGAYSPTDRSCIYSIPTDVRAAGEKVFMMLYHGTPGNATLLRSEAVVDGIEPATLVQVTSPGSFINDFQTGDHFFGVVVPSGPIDPITTLYPELTQFNEAFSNGSVATPNNTYHLINWQLGEFDTTGPTVTVTSPVEGGTYPIDQVVTLLAEVTDPAGVQSVQYTVNDAVVVGANLPLPLNLFGLGPAYLTVYALDTFGNYSLTTVNFTVVPPVPTSTHCIYALSATAKPALKASGQAEVDASCGLQVNSSAVGAVEINGSAKIAVVENCVVGSVKKNGNASIAPSPTTPCSATANPFASFVAPVVGACQYSNIHINGSQVRTLNPGVYCGDLKVSGQAQVTLNPGLYVIKDGKLDINGSGKVTGSGASFFITGSNAGVKLSGQADLTTSAMSEGALNGFAYVVQGTAGSELNGASTLHTSGHVYMGEQKLKLSGQAKLTLPTGSLVADTLELNGSSEIEVQ